MEKKELEDQTTEEKTAEETKTEENSAGEQNTEKQKTATYDEAYITGLRSQFEEEKQAAVAEAVEAARQEISAKAAEEAKVSGMTAEEKAAYESDKREKQLAERESAIALRELTAEAKSLLAEQGLPPETLDSVLGRDLESTKANITAYKKTLDAAVQAQVTERLKGRTPERGTGTGSEDAEAVAAEFAKYL